MTTYMKAICFSLFFCTGWLAASDGAQLISSDLPTSLSCGSSYNARVTMRNTGTSTWTRDTHKLGAVNDTDPFRQNHRVWLPTGVTVAPGETYTFNFILEADQAMSPGSYLTQWRMVHEFVAWFGPTASKNVGVTCTADEAQLISSNLPSSLNCGQTFQAQVTMRNTGTATWTRDTHKLGAVDGSDPFYNLSRVKLPHGTTVSPGQSYTFSFTLTASGSMQGNFLTDWRMVHEGVAWFGPTASRNVNVSCVPDAAVLVSADLPNLLLCGDSYEASVTMRNTGSATWTRTTHKLGAVDSDDPFYNNSRIWLPSGVTVAPGEQYTFRFTLSADSNMNPGNYTTDWRMVHEHVAWFGPISQSQVLVTCVPDVDAAEVVSHNLPAQLNCGDSFTAHVVMRNTGTTTWTRDTHKLGRVNQNDPFTSVNRIKLPHNVTVAPGQTHTFAFTLTADEGMSSGSYLSDWQMVHELVAWFGDHASHNVNVNCSQTFDDARLINAVLPEGINCGQAFQATVIMKNTGTTTWTRATHRLYAVGGSDPFRTTPRVLLPSGVTVPPDGTHSFTFSLSADSNMNPGPYLTDWRMLHEGVGQFGDTASESVDVTCGPAMVDDAQVISETIPGNLNCGESVSVSVTMKNTGTTTWTRNTHKLGVVGDSDPFFNGSRIWLPSGVTVSPGQNHTFTFTLTAPADINPGPYLTDWRMVHENVAWFGATASQVVQTQCNTDGAQLLASVLPSSLSCGQSFNASVTMKNTGTTTWTRSTFRLGARGDSDPFFAGTRVLLPSGVNINPGQQHTFTFTLAAPSNMNPGPYVTDWQMVHEHHAWFGPIASRTVNVTCNTPGQDGATLQSANLPSNLDPGDNFTASVTMTNTGTTTWTRATHKLGAVDDEDPFYPGNRILLPSGASVSPGQSHTFTFTMNAPATLPPDVYLTDWRMVHEGTGWFGDIASSNVNVGNTNPPGAPVLDSVGPDEIINGRKTVVTITGQNLLGSSISIPVEQTDPGNPVTRIFPTAQLLSINGTGTQMTIEIDATDSRIIDYYNIRVDNGIDDEAIPFRVLPPGPLVDLWTPKEPERGKVYVLSLVGHHLQGASVSASVGGRVHIFGIDNSREDRINGLLEVLPNAALGPIHLVVRDPSGRSVSLPITIMPDGQSRAATRELVADANSLQSSGSSSPNLGNVSLKFQEFSLRMPHLTEAGENVNVLDPSQAQNATTRGFDFSIYITYTFNLARFHWQQALIFDPETGEIGDRILQALDIGDQARIGGFVLSFYLEVNLTVYFRITNNGFSFPLFCLEIFAALEIPGFQGQALYFNYCVGGDSVNFTSGNTSQVGFTGGPCAQVTPEGPVLDGFAYAEVRQTDCCEQPIGLSAQGSSFTGSGFSVPNFNVFNPEAGMSTPIPDCSGGGCDNSLAIEGPTCIGEDRQRTFTASANGGTFKWRIVEGAEKAEIVGSDTQRSVRIKGTQHSDLANDVTLEVTHTLDGQSCTATEDFTVLKVLLHWRQTNQWDSDNAAIQRPTFGHPHLGPIVRGLPPAPQATGFFKNMEIKASVLPCDPNLECTFEFKRIREGRAGVWTSQVPFVPHDGDCPVPCLDGVRHERDSDHTLDGEPGCGVFAVDSPGMNLLTCGVNGQYIMNCMNFQEWLEVDGDRVASLLWYASTRLKCINGAYDLDSGGQGNIMGLGRIDCSLDAAQANGLAHLDPSLTNPQLRQMVQHKFRDVRLMGVANIIHRHRIGTLSKYGMLYNVLNKMTKEPSGGEHYSRPLIAIQLMGMLQMERGVDVLIDNILEDYPRVIYSSTEGMTPAAISLGQIGVPAIETIFEAASVVSDKEWEMLEKALNYMVDQTAVDEARTQYLAFSVDKLSQERLRNFGD